MSSFFVPTDASTASQLCPNCEKKGLIPRKIMKGKKVCSRCNASKPYDAVRKQKELLKLAQAEALALDLEASALDFKDSRLALEKANEERRARLQARRTNQTAQEAETGLQRMDLRSAIEKATKPT